MTFWDLLEPQLHPHDRPALPAWRDCYEMKFALARLIRPRSILEIGVRAGYSALALLTASPEATYLGLDNDSDTHGGFRGAIDHARRILADYPAEILEVSSADYAARLSANGTRPTFDLVHVDGDHSLTGCLADLRLASALGPRVILVDDVLGLPDVSAAWEQFLIESKDRWLPVIIPDGHLGVGLLMPNPLSDAPAKEDRA